MATGTAVDHPAFIWDLVPSSEARTLLFSGAARERLSAAEIEIFERLATEKRRLDWLCGRLAAKRALAALRPSLSPREIEILSSPDGKPYFRLAGGEPPELSISHCAKGGICAVSRAKTPVGVDFEPVAAHGPAVVAMFMHAAEALPLDEEAALWQTKLWTAKEAVLKLLGTGLACDPRDVRWFERTQILELEGLAKRRWLELGGPKIRIEHKNFEDCMIAFAHCGGN